jgi:Fe-S cluster biogenesis protein NfuA
MADEELIEKVKAVIEKVRPMLQSHGGDIEFVDMDGGVVKVRLKGACAGCPAAQMTLSMGVERALKEEIPEVTGVEAVPF